MDQGADFTIDFVEEQYRQPVKMLMDILCIDMKQAYELFIMSGCNTQAAINIKTNPSPQKPHFDESVPRNNRGRGRRNGAINDLHAQINEFQYQYDFDENYDDQFERLPLARRGPPPKKVPEETEFDVKFNKLLEYKRKKKSFENMYVVKRLITQGDSRTISMKIFDKKAKKPQEKKILDIRPFHKQIEKGLTQKMITIKFGKGSMSQSLQQCLKTFHPLLAFHLNFDIEENMNSKTNKQKNSKNTFKPRKMVIDITDDNNQDQKMVEVDESKNVQEYVFKKSEKNEFFKSLLTDKKLERVANDCYLNYIFDAQSYDMEAYLKEYFQKSTRTQSYLVVLRVNYLEEIQIVAKIGLDQILQRLKQKDEKGFEEQIANIVQQLKKLSEKCKKIQNEQDKLMDRYNLFKQGIYHYEYKKPPTTAEKIKIKEDREIIRQQQEEFMNMHNQFVQHQIKQIQNQEQEKLKIPKQEILEKRKIVKSFLTTYNEGDPDIMMIKFRLPSGKNIILHVSIKEKVQYLFDYIFSHQMENLGFEEEQDGGFSLREFDIIRPEDRLSLESKMDVPLEDLFEGSLMESVIIKEKS